jgi:hypothetical protein
VPHPAVASGAGALPVLSKAISDGDRIQAPQPSGLLDVRPLRAWIDRDLALIQKGEFSMLVWYHDSWICLTIDSDLSLFTCYR